jgi:hypothetical protein
MPISVDDFLGLCGPPECPLSSLLQPHPTQRLRMQTPLTAWHSVGQTSVDEFFGIECPNHPPAPPQHLRAPP